MNPGVIIVVALLLVVITFVTRVVKVIRPYERGVVERLGRYHGTVDPGLRIIVPFVDVLRRVDIREQVIDVPPQELITKDNVVVAVDAVIYYEPVDAQRLVYNIGNFLLAITKLAQTNLRNVVGDMQLDEALTSRDTINTGLRDILDEATDTWGVKVKRVEIQRIDPPPDVMASMHEQMKAERTRRAVVTEAEGSRTAAITAAEGAKQAAILRAEAVKESQVLEAAGQAEATRLAADAERYRLTAEATGQADAVTKVYEAMLNQEPTAELIALKYIETLGHVAHGAANKIFLPSDPNGVFGAIAAAAEAFKAGATTAPSDDVGEDAAAEDDDHIFKPPAVGRIPDAPARPVGQTPLPGQGGGQAPPRPPGMTPQG